MLVIHALCYSANGICASPTPCRQENRKACPCSWLWWDRWRGDRQTDMMPAKRGSTYSKEGDIWGGF